MPQLIDKFCPKISEKGWGKGFTELQEKFICLPYVAIPVLSPCFVMNRDKCN